MDKRIIFKKVNCPRCFLYLGEGTVGFKVRLKCPECGQKIVAEINKDKVKIEIEDYGKEKF